MSETFSCPNCGYGLEVGTPTCGNCGTILQGRSAVPPPLAASGIRPSTVLVFALAVAAAGGMFFARGFIADLFEADSVQIVDNQPQPVEIVPGKGRERPGGGGGGSDGDGKGGGKGETRRGYGNVGEIVRAIRAGGIPCSGMVVDHSDDILATGSCQSSGSHVQINIYFAPAAIEGAKDFYDDFAFASVHADNWWVSGETSLMARIQKAIGGRLLRPSP